MASWRALASICAYPHWGVIDLLAAVALRKSKGVGVTLDTSDMAGKNTSRYRFREKAVNATMNSNPQVHRLPARCRSKFSLYGPLFQRTSQEGFQRCNQPLPPGGTAISPWSGDSGIGAP